MGFPRDWIEVVVGTMFFGGAVLLGQVLWNHHNRLQPSLTLVEIFASALAGLGLGIVMTFQSKAFDWPLIALTIPTLSGALFLGRPFTRKTHPE